MSDQTDDLLTDIRKSAWAILNRVPDDDRKRTHAEYEVIHDRTNRLAASLRASRERVAELVADRDNERSIKERYAHSARVIHLYLAEFCDESLKPDAMIAEAGRRAAVVVNELRGDVMEEARMRRESTQVQQRRWERLRASLGDDDRKLGMDLTIDAVIAKLAESQATVARLTAERDAFKDAYRLGELERLPPHRRTRCPAGLRLRGPNAP